MACATGGGDASPGNCRLRWQCQRKGRLSQRHGERSEPLRGRLRRLCLWRGRLLAPIIVQGRKGLDFIYAICPPGILSQILVGLSRTVILFIVASGLTLILGVLRIPNVAHGSLYMIGAFMAFTISRVAGGGTLGFWLALVGAPLGVAALSFMAERGLFRYLYEREHLMLLLLTFALSLVLGDLVKLGWGGEYKSVPVPAMFQGSVALFGGLPFPVYNLFLLVLGPFVALALWLLVNKTRHRKDCAGRSGRQGDGRGRRDQRKLALCDRFYHRLLPCGPRGRLRRSHGERDPRHGRHAYHGSFSHRHRRRLGQRLGGPSRRPHLWLDPVARHSRVAPVRHRFPLHGGHRRAPVQADGTSQIDVVDAG